MKIPLVDLKAQYNSLKADIDGAIARVIDGGQFILGPEVKSFEQEVAAYIGVKHAVGVASGTDALHLALLACGIGPGDEVITTPFTFIATSEAIAKCGATPVFADIDLSTCNLDPSQVARKITPKTRAILPVHLYGQPGDMAAILKLARANNLKVIEDCAQAMGAAYQGKKVGSLGDAGCFSFFPSKGIGAYGDGGMVTTNHPEIAAKVDSLRRHGAGVAYYYAEVGFNSRLDALQAAILSVKLKHLDDWTRRRRQKALAYAGQLSRINGLALPSVGEAGSHSFNYYTIRLKDSKIDRNKLRQHLEASGISSAIYYPFSLHLQEVYQPLGYHPGDFPRSEQAQEQVISLPIYPELSDEQIARITGALIEFLG